MNMFSTRGARQLEGAQLQHSSWALSRMSTPQSDITVLQIVSSSHCLLPIHFAQQLKAVASGHGLRVHQSCHCGATVLSTAHSKRCCCVAAWVRRRHIFQLAVLAVVMAVDRALILWLLKRRLCVMLCAAVARRLDALEKKWSSEHQGDEGDSSD